MENKMNIDDLTIKQARELAKVFCAGETPAYDNGMIGEYVIVRCRDAGVHAGILVSHHNRECVLERARRLWYWKPLRGAAFLSGVAKFGLDSSSKVGVEQTIHLTETCEIALCATAAAESIQDAISYEK